MKFKVFLSEANKKSLQIIMNNQNGFQSFNKQHYNWLSTKIKLE